MKKETKKSHTDLSIEYAIHQANFWGNYLKKEKAGVEEKTLKVDIFEKTAIQSGAYSSLIHTAIEELERIEKILKAI